MVVHFFGKLADIAGSKELQLEPRKCSEDLVRMLEEKLPELERYEYMLTVNEEMISGNRELDPNDEIALLPPFSGG